MIPRILARRGSISPSPEQVFAAPHARTNWAHELAKFGLLLRNVQVTTSAADTVDPDADVVIVSYDLTVRPSIQRQLLAQRPELPCPSCRSSLPASIKHTSLSR